MEPGEKKFFMKHLTSERGILAIAVMVLIIAFVLCQPITPRMEAPVMRAAAALGASPDKIPEIAIVEIDEKTAKELGSWPWSAKSIMEVFARLQVMQAKLVIVDPEIVADSGLAGANPNAFPGDPQSIVMGYRFYPTLADMPAGDEGTSVKQDIKPDDLEGISFPSKPVDDSRIAGMTGIEMLGLPPALRGRIGEGYYNVFPDSGFVSAQPLAVRFRGRAMPSVAVTALARWRGFTPILAVDPNNRPSGINIGDDFIPTGADARIVLSLEGPMGTFPRTNAGDILGGKVSDGAFAEKIVFLGLAGALAGPPYSTAVGRLDELEIQANVLKDILHKEAVTSLIGYRHAIPMVIILAIIAASAVAPLPNRRRILALPAAIAIIWVAAILLMKVAYIWIPATQLTIAAIAIAAAMAGWQLFERILPQRILSHQFGWRLARSSIENLISDRSPIRPEGHTCLVTAMAVDIKGFGALTTRLSPSEFTRFVTQYRLLLSELIISHGGMVESWTGDDCRAVFGAPHPISEHPLRACMAALEIRKTMKVHATKFAEEFGIERLNVGIGVQTGIAVAGDFGLGYDIGGGALEAAVQLRTQCRVYKTWALIGNSTYEATKSSFEFRALDPVQLWGEQKPTTIFELVGESGLILPAEKMFEEARQAYLKGQFELAARLFERTLAAYPSDGPSRLFLRRSILLKNSPPEHWSGVWKQI